MEKGGLAKRSSHPLGRYRGMESFRRRKHVLQYGKDRFRQRQHQTAIPHIHREKGDRLSFRPRLCHLRKQQCYLSSRRRQSGEVQPHRILHLSRLRRRAHRQHEPHVSQCRYSCQEGYNQPSGSHLINLINKEWNQCFLEIDEYQRDKVMSITFSTALKGKDRTTGDSAIYYLDNLQLQTVKAPEKVSGWIPADGKISYSTTGYAVNHPKTALINTNLTIDAGKRFQLLTPTGEIAYEGDIRKEKTTLGEFGLIDFTSFNNPGEYQLKVGTSLTPTFRIGERLWEDSQWKVLNFIFCQRCGHPVPGKHSTCHVDLMSRHDGRSISYSGGWHDAGDLSQQTLQTGDVTFALLEAYNKQRNINPALAARLREEAEWGVEFILKNRYGDGYRASSMGLLIWQDGVFNTLDDISSVRVQNMAFDNFLYAGYEAYASMTLDNDPMLQEYLLRVAEEDFAFAMEKFKKIASTSSSSLTNTVTTLRKVSIWLPSPGRQANYTS